MSGIGLAQIYASSPVEKMKLDAVIHSYADKGDFCKYIGIPIDEKLKGPQRIGRIGSTVRKLMLGEVPLDSYQWERVEGRFRSLEPEIREYWLRLYGIKMI